MVLCTCKIDQKDYCRKEMESNQSCYKKTNSSFCVNLLPEHPSIGYCSSLHSRATIFHLPLLYITPYRSFFSCSDCHVCSLIAESFELKGTSSQSPSPSVCIVIEMLLLTICHPCQKDNKSSTDYTHYVLLPNHQFPSLGIIELAVCSEIYCSKGNLPTASSYIRDQSVNSPCA